jgi:hypothetical protein
MKVPKPESTTERNERPAAAVRTIGQPRFHSPRAVSWVLNIDPLNATCRKSPGLHRPAASRHRPGHADGDCPLDDAARRTLEISSERRVRVFPIPGAHLASDG